MIAGDSGRTAQDQLQRQEDEKYEYRCSRFMHTLHTLMTTLLTTCTHAVNNDAIKLTADLLHLFITGTYVHYCVNWPFNTCIIMAMICTWTIRPISLLSWASILYLHLHPPPPNRYNLNTMYIQKQHTGHLNKLRWGLGVWHFWQLLNYYFLQDEGASQVDIQHLEKILPKLVLILGVCNIGLHACPI